MGVLRAHISKTRPGPLPEEDAENSRDFCEECEQDIEELLASYGFVLEYLSAEGEDQEDVGEDEEEDQGDHEQEYEGEHEGEAEQEDEAGVQEEAMLALVQTAPLTLTLLFVGGKRGRDVAADEEEPAAKRGRFIEEHQTAEGEHEGEDHGEDERGVQVEAMLAPVQPAALTSTLPFVGGKRGREVAADEEEPATKRGRYAEEEL
jgi:hypothetical protein